MVLVNAFHNITHGKASLMKRIFRLRLLAMLVVLTLTLSILTTNIVKAESTIWEQTSNPSAENDEALSVAVDDTGVYIVGNDVSPGEAIDQWRIQKRNLTDGSIIWEETSDPSPASEMPLGVSVDDTGIYVVGYDQSPSSGIQWRIEKRSLTDGSLIPSFGTGGVATSHPSTSDDEASGVAVDETGIYVVGFDQSPGDYEWRIEKRSLTDGSIIWEQSSNPSARDDYAFGVAVDASGVYIVGIDESLGMTDHEWRIEKRSLTDGSIIWEQPSNPGAGDDRALGVAVDGTGVYIIGFDWSSGGREWRIEKRSLVDGSPIPTFGTGGVVTSNPTAENEEALGVALDASGIYVVGFDQSPGDSEWRIEKRHLSAPDFSISADPSSISIAWGASGSSTINITSRYGFSDAVALSHSWFGGTPSDVTVNLPGPVTPPPDDSATTTLQISAGGSATTGTFTLRVTGSIGTISKSVDVSVEITATPTPSPTPRPGCIVATAAYGSELAPEVVYMRHVRDNMIGSSQIGRTLVNGWNKFYYSWSPSIANFIAAHGPSQPVFRAFLLPLVGTIHLTASVYTVSASINAPFASVVAFLFAAISSITIYVLLPLFAFRSIYGRQFKPHLNPR